MKHPRKTLMQRIMEETILLGGEVMTRAEAVTSLKADGCSERCIDFFVFGPHVIVVDLNSKKEE